MNYFFLVLAIIFNLMSYLIYKGIANRQADLIWYIIFSTGLILGGMNVYFFTKALKNINLSIAYPIFSGVTIALMIILSYLIFHEKMNIYNIFGVLTVIAGIVLLTK
jgi:small multidrug resistance pump